jgi:hypothetical protein
MKLAFGNEPGVEAYEELLRQRDELLALNDKVNTDLKSAEVVRDKWLGEYLRRQQEARERFEELECELIELKSSLNEKEFDLSEAVDDGISYRAACDNEFREFVDEELTAGEKLTLLKSDVNEMAKERAASTERAALNELVSDVKKLSVKITEYREASPITSRMVREGLRGIKELDAIAREKFKSIYDNRVSELRAALDGCWTLAKELAEMCPERSGNGRQRSGFSNNLGAKIVEASNLRGD